MVMLIGIGLLSPVLLLLPARGNKTQVQDDREYLQSELQPASINQQAIWSALLATLIFFSSISAVWAFMERLGNSAGFDPDDIGFLFAAALGFATLGSLAAAGIGRRYGNIRPFLVSLLLIAASLLLLADSSSMSIYFMGCCLFALAFGAGRPFAIVEIAELDVDGR